MNNLAQVEQGFGVVPFSNPGEIDPRMWATFGVSVKESAGAIGQFGTGLKYAIAVLMREGRSLEIVSKGNRYVFGVKQTDIRGKDFMQITCNSEMLPFTTHLGAKWELWQAYRELYSNCLDEGGNISSVGDTVIYAELGDIDHDEVFLNKSSRKLIVSSKYCDVYTGSSTRIYCKGIRASGIPRESLYTYDLKLADLTEDRTLKYMFQVDQAISTAVIEGEETELAENFLFCSKDKFEQHICFDNCRLSPSGAILNFVSKHRKDRIYMQEKLRDVAIQKLGSAVYTVSDMDDRQARVISKAKEFCKQIGYEIRFPVVLSLDLGRSVLGLADRTTEQIFLSDTVLCQGVKQVAATLIEENLHLEKGLSDCSYEMQSYLFDQIVTMGERLTGEVI